jgi:hypothetical protein
MILMWYLTSPDLEEGTENEESANPGGTGLHKAEGVKMDACAGLSMNDPGFLPDLRPGASNPYVEQWKVDGGQRGRLHVQ